MSVDFVNVQNTLDLYQQQLVHCADLFNLKATLWSNIDEFTERLEVSQRGVRTYFWSEEAGGHTLPTLSQPDLNRTKAPQSDSGWAKPMMYGIPIVIDIHLLNDAGGNNAPKKAAAMFKMSDLLMQYTKAAAKHQEFFVCGNGYGVLAYSSTSLTVPGAGQTMTCDTSADAAPGHTKGAVRLKKNQYYQSFDTTTGLPEGTILVTSQNNKTQATVTLVSGVVTSGNPICDVGGYGKAPMGFTGLLDDTSRILQGRDTSVDTIFNVPTLDLANTRMTVSDRETIKTMEVVLNAEDGARTGQVCLTTPGLMSDLRKQQYGFRRAAVDDPAADITKVYKDVDGTKMMESVDWDEDRHAFFKSNTIQKHTEIPFGEVNPDGLAWRNLLGANQTGSLLNGKWWGCSWTLVITNTLAGATIKRASTSSITTQVVVGAGN
jgi:hypothetical protein